MSDLKKTTAGGRLPNWSLVIVAALFVLFLVSRLFNLLKLPVFIDEAIHIWWAREIQEGLIASGFLEGRWFSMVLISLSLHLPGEDLGLIRFTAVLAGVATMGAILLTGREKPLQVPRPIF